MSCIVRCWAGYYKYPEPSLAIRDFKIIKYNRFLRLSFLFSDLLRNFFRRLLNRFTLHVLPSIPFNSNRIAPTFTMARTLQTLIPHPPIAGTPFFRRPSQLPTPAYSPFFVSKSNVAPLLWKLRSVSRIHRITASAKPFQVPHHSFF